MNKRTMLTGVLVVILALVFACIEVSARGRGGGGGGRSGGGRSRGGGSRSRSHGGSRGGRGSVRHSSRKRSSSRGRSSSQRSRSRSSSQRSRSSKYKTHRGSQGSRPKNYGSVRHSQRGGRPQQRPSNRPVGADRVGRGGRGQGNRGQVVRNPNRGGRPSQLPAGSRPGVGRPGRPGAGRPGRPGAGRPGHGRPGGGGRLRPGHLPAGGRYHNYRGHRYWGYGRYWYRPYWYGGSVYYYPTYPPEGYYYDTLPEGYTSQETDNGTLYASDGVYYQKGEQDGKEGYVVAPAPKGAETPDEPETPDPFDTLKAMSDYMGKQQGFMFNADITIEDPDDSGDMIQKSAKRKVSVQRPDKLMARLEGNGVNRQFVYDGSKITLIDNTRKVYTTADMPDRIETMLDRLAKKYEVAAPLGDLLYPDSYEALTEHADSGQYLGMAQVGNDWCHHLSFTQEAVDWEIWIEPGDTPMPRKVRIVYKSHEGQPRFTAKLSRLAPVANFPEEVFEATIPDGYEKIDLMEAVKRVGPDFDKDEE